MSKEPLQITRRLYDYILDVGFRDDPLLAALRAETAKLPNAMMQISPEQGQFMQLLVRTLGARRCLEIGTFTGYSSLAIVLLTANVQAATQAKAQAVQTAKAAADQTVLTALMEWRALVATSDDCDALRAYPAFKLAVRRLPESGLDLCSQPTMCRLENLPGPMALKRMIAAMVQLDRLHRSSLRQLSGGAAPHHALHRAGVPANAVRGVGTTPRIGYTAGSRYCSARSGISPRTPP